MKLKHRILLIWYWITFDEIGRMACRRELFRPDFKQLIRNIYKLSILAIAILISSSCMAQNRFEKEFAKADSAIVVPDFSLKEVEKIYTEMLKPKSNVNKILIRKHRKKIKIVLICPVKP